MFSGAKKPEARKEGDRFFVYVKSKRREGRANDEAIPPTTVVGGRWIGGGARQVDKIEKMLIIRAN